MTDILPLLKNLKQALPGSTEQRRGNMRRELQQRRKALDPRQQLRASSMVCRQVLVHPIYHRARRIAFYLPANGEIDPVPLLQHALKAGKHCYLPALSPLREGKMYFVRVRAGQFLHSNRWGIFEPPLRQSDIVRPWALDLVFVPLVGFDARGNRLGMGMGYYDRAFTCRQGLGGRALARRHSPTLMGLAHECQRLADIPVHYRDIPMDQVVSA